MPVLRPRRPPDRLRPARPPRLGLDRARRAGDVARRTRGFTRWSSAGRRARWSRTSTATASSTSPRASPSRPPGTATRAVVAAIRRQSARLIHMSGTDFYYTPQVRLAERLARLAPGPGPKRVFFTNSGAEAVEAALKLARRHTGRLRALAFLGAFHGRTYGAMSLSGSKNLQRRGFAPLVPEIHHARLRRPRRRPRPARAPSARPTSSRPSSSSRSRARAVTSSRPTTSCPACARSATSTASCSCSTRSSRASAGPGRMFASEHWGVAGDIVCLAKGIANGLPLGAIVARADVMDWPSGSHASTFGGNPVACAAALATLRLVETRYRANAERRGRELKQGLAELAARHPCIKDVRGLGLMIGVEIADGGVAGAGLRDRIIDLAFRRGLLLLPCGASTVRFCPPLCLSARQVQIGLEIFRDALLASEDRSSPRLN